MGPSIACCFRVVARRYPPSFPPLNTLDTRKAGVFSRLCREKSGSEVSIVKRKAFYFEFVAEAATLVAMARAHDDDPDLLFPNFKN